MTAGRLNKKIVIEHNATTRDNMFGEELSSELQNLPARADVVWGSGRRETADMEVVFSYDVTFIVWIYFYTKIKEGDTIHYMGKKYQVVSMEPQPETRILYLRAQTL